MLLGLFPTKDNQYNTAHYFNPLKLFYHHANLGKINFYENA